MNDYYVGPYREHPVYCYAGSILRFQAASPGKRPDIRLINRPFHLQPTASKSAIAPDT
jgi:hypothetical protein